MTTWWSGCKGYVVKAAREAKQHTSWTDPDVDYEDVVTSFVDAVARRDRSSAQSMTRFCRGHRGGCTLQRARAGRAQVVGARRARLLPGNRAHRADPHRSGQPEAGRLSPRAPPSWRRCRDTSPTGAAELLSTWPDGRLKLHVTRTLLRERRRHPSSSDRAPTSRWRRRPTTQSPSCADRRTECVLAVVPRLAYRLAGPGRHPIGGEVVGRRAGRCCPMGHRCGTAICSPAGLVQAEAGHSGSGISWRSFPSPRSAP